MFIEESLQNRLKKNEKKLKDSNLNKLRQSQP